MFKAFKYRIYPTQLQEQLLAKHFGAVRFVYNIALETKNMSYSGTKTIVNRYALQQQLVDLKRSNEWLCEVNSQSLQYPILCLEKAMEGFFKGHKEYPVFKKKHGKQSFTCPQRVSVSGTLLFMPKFRSGIPIKLSRPLKGAIKTATISKTATGKYFVSLLCDNGENIPSKRMITEDSSVGIDFGIKTFLTLSTGEIYENNRFLKKNINRLKILQKRSSRKIKSSNNKKKSNFRIAILHERIANQREDYLHKTSTSIIKKYDTICIENLNISGMVKNHNLAQSISDTGWNTFEKMLQYKAEWYGKNIIYIDRFYPSSKTCSACGNIKIIKLSERTYNCNNCGIEIDRDLNASINIKNSGLGKSVVPVELSTIVEAKKQESNHTMPTPSYQ